MALNSIGPAVAIARRGDGWCVRFRLPEHVARKYSLPRRPRLGCRLPRDASDDCRVREANRIGALLEMLVIGRDAPADEQSLAAWLGLPEPAPKRPTDRSASSKPGDRWPYVVKAYAEEYRSRTLSREGNESLTLGRLDRIAAAFPKRHPDDISARQWSQWLDCRSASLLGSLTCWGVAAFSGVFV